MDPGPLTAWTEPPAQLAGKDLEQRTRGTRAVCGAGVTARGQQDSLGGRAGSGPRGAAGTPAHGGSLGAGSFCPHPSAAVAGGQHVHLEVCASLSPFLWVSFLFFQCKEPRQGVSGEQRGRPDHCPSQTPPAALTGPMTTSLAIVSQPRPEKDFVSSTQQSHFLFSPRNSPGPAGRTPRMNSRSGATRPAGEGRRSRRGPGSRGLAGPSASPRRPTRAAFEIRPAGSKWSFYC